MTHDEIDTTRLLKQLSKWVGRFASIGLIVWLSFLVTIGPFIGLVVLSSIVAFANYFEGRAAGELDNLENS